MEHKVTDHPWSCSVCEELSKYNMNVVALQGGYIVVNSTLNSTEYSSVGQMMECRGQ